MWHKFTRLKEIYLNKMLYTRNLIMEKRIHKRTGCAKRRVSQAANEETSNRYQPSTPDHEVINTTHILGAATVCVPGSEHSPSPNRTGSESAGSYAVG